MKILILSPTFPVPHSGFQVRVFNIIQNLARNHDITLVSLIRHSEVKYLPLVKSLCTKIEVVAKRPLTPLESFKSLFAVEGKMRAQLRRLGNVLQGVPVDVARWYLQEYKEKVDSLLRKEAYDILQIESIFLEQYANRELIEKTNTKVVLIEHDISYIRVYREYLQARPPLKPLKYLQFQMLRRYEIAAWQRVDRIAAVSQVDREKIRDHDPSLKVWIIPNPVDASYYRPPIRRERGNEVLWIGGLDFPANYDAVLYFLREILSFVLERTPDVKVTIVGRHSEGQRKIVEAFPSVEVAGFVEDIRPYLDRADVFIVPLRIAGGTRLKILTAMAAGLPVVSTSIGCEGIEAVAEKEILLADRPREFAGQIVRLLEDRDLSETLQVCGRRLVETRYTWEVLDLEPMLQEIHEEEA